MELPSRTVKAKRPKQIRIPPKKVSSSDSPGATPYLDRELSQLAVNRRVLAQAEQGNSPAGTAALLVHSQQQPG